MAFTMMLLWVTPLPPTICSLSMAVMPKLLNNTVSGAGVEEIA